MKGTMRKKRGAESLWELCFLCCLCYLCYLCSLSSPGMKVNQGYRVDDVLVLLQNPSMFLQNRVWSVPLGRGLPSYDLGDFFINFGRICEPKCDGHADFDSKLTQISPKSIQNRDQSAPEQVLKNLSFFETSLEGSSLWFLHISIHFGSLFGAKMCFQNHQTN